VLSSFYPLHWYLVEKNHFITIFIDEKDVEVRHAPAKLIETCKKALGHILLVIHKDDIGDGRGRVRYHFNNLICIMLRILGHILYVNEAISNIRF